MVTILGKLLLKVDRRLVSQTGISRKLGHLQTGKGFTSVPAETGGGLTSVPADYRFIADPFRVLRREVWWSGPPPNTIKGNCDYSGRPAGAGVSFFFRNCDCDYIGGGYEEVPSEANSTTGEGYALLKTLDKGDELSMGKSRVWMETDCKSVIDDLDNVKQLGSEYRALMDNIGDKIEYLEVKCGGCEATFIHREGNDPANILSRLSAKGKLDFPSVDKFPLSIRTKMIAVFRLNKIGEWFTVVKR